MYLTVGSHGWTDTASIGWLDRIWIRWTDTTSIGWVDRMLIRFTDLTVASHGCTDTTSMDGWIGFVDWMWIRWMNPMVGSDGRV